MKQHAVLDLRLYAHVQERFVHRMSHVARQS